MEVMLRFFKAMLRFMGAVLLCTKATLPIVEAMLTYKAAIRRKHGSWYRWSALSAYGPATPCPERGIQPALVLVERGGRLHYAISGTSIARTHCPVLTRRTAYALPATGIPYGVVGLRARWERAGIGGVGA
eukprot:1128162-Rhodomonas_salina.2